MTGTVVDRARTAVAAVRDLMLTAAPPAGTSRGTALPRSPRVQALLAEQVARLGLDSAAIERELAAEYAADQSRLEDLKAAAVAESAAQHVVEPRPPIGGVEGVRPRARTQYLDTPVEIWATNRMGLESSTMQPYNSSAKFDFHDEFDESFIGAYLEAPDQEWLHFVYAWTNPPDAGYASVTVSANLVLDGFCSVHSRGGWFSNGSARMTLDPTLNLVQTWTQPNSYPPAQGGQTWQALDLAADSSGFDTDSKTKYASVYRGCFLNYDNATVPPGQLLLIDVALRISSTITRGENNADFASGQFGVLSPGVELAIVS